MNWKLLNAVWRKSPAKCCKAHQSSSVDSVLYLHHLRFDSQTLNLLLCRQILLDSEAFVFTESLLIFRKKPTQENMFFAKMEVVTFSPFTTKYNAIESHYWYSKDAVTCTLELLLFFPSTSKFSVSSSSQYDFTSMITLTITITQQ